MELANMDIVNDRLEELYSYLQNFPESKIASCVKNEIEYLESLF